MASNHDALMRLIFQFMEDKNELTLAEIQLSGGSKRMVKTVVEMSKDGGPDPVARWHRFEAATKRVYGPKWSDAIDQISHNPAENGLFYCSVKGCKELCLQGPCDRCIMGIIDGALKV